MSVSPSLAPRNAALDLLRGWAIIGVVAIHASGLALPANAYFNVSHYFRWAVPIFICAYAFHGARPVPPGQVWAQIRQRYRRLLLPFVVYSLMYLLLLGPGPDGWGAALLRQLRGDGWAGQYFFLLLFQLIPLLPWLARWHMPGWLVLLALALHTAMTPTLLPWVWQQAPLLQFTNDRLLIYWLPYVLLGVYLFQNRHAWRSQTQRLPRPWSLALLLALPLLLSLTRTPDWPTGPYLLSAVALVSCAIYWLHERALTALATAAPLRPLVALGHHSMAVFCLNPLCVHLLQRGLPPDASPVALRPLLLPALAACALVLLICLLCWLAGAMLRKTPLRAVAA